jgi:hypothetical protein
MIGPGQSPDILPDEHAFWVWMKRMWGGWQDALTIVDPAFRAGHATSRTGEIPSGAMPTRFPARRIVRASVPRTGFRWSFFTTGCDMLTNREEEHP